MLYVAINKSQRLFRCHTTIPTLVDIVYMSILIIA